MSSPKAGKMQTMAPIPDDAWQPIRDHWAGGLRDVEWVAARQSFPVGAVVTGRVLACLRMGVFVAIADRLVGQIEAPEVSDDVDSPQPEVGTVVTAVVLRHVDRNQQICLSTRASTIRRMGSERITDARSRRDGPER